MKKITSFLLLMLLISFGVRAQHSTVQGIPHFQMRNSVKADPAVVYPNIDFEDILYWVGSGNNLSALVVKWDDGKGGNTNLVWGYRWTTAAEGTGEAMLRAIAKADPRFYMLVYGNTQYGAAFGGMGFDLNGNGNMALVKGGTSYSLTDGIYNTTTYDFDSYTSNDPLDHWCAGWTKGYWSYWTTHSMSKAYDYSSVGASSRKLSNGSIDGWSYMSDMSTWYSNDMSGTPEYVAIPVKATLVNRVANQEDPVTNKNYTVSTLEDFRNILENKAIDGDTIQFYAGLRGTVLQNDNDPVTGCVINKAVTIMGNGVIIGTGTGFNFFERGKSITFKDIVFQGITKNAISVTNSNLRVEGCIFEEGSSEFDGTAIRYENTEAHTTPIQVWISHCRFSNNKCTSSNGRGTVSLKDTPSGKDSPMLDARIVSCTFENNEIPEGSAISILNYPNAYFTNCVFEGNKATAEGGVTIYIHRKDNVPAERVRSLGYNVIEGTITETTAKRLQESDVLGTELDSILQLENNEYKVIKNGLAYNHLPANTVIEGMVWPKTDIAGTLINYSQATHSGACQLIYDPNSSPVDYTDGVFIVNEDWYGHQNSTVNYITAGGEWIYRVFQKENPGMELGCTNQYGAIYGDKFYFVAKQAKDPGATVTGARLTVCDAKTLKCLKQIENLSVDDQGTSNADGRGFLGVNEHKAYIGSNNGIFIYDIDKMEIKGKITGTGHIGGSDYDELYKGQIGNMVRVNENVFAVHQKNGIIVIDAQTDTLKQVIAGPGKWGYGSLVLSKDGNLWASVANTTGNGESAPYIYKINPTTCDTTRIDMPEGIYAPANSWYAWTPDCFCAGNQKNILYWNGGNGGWFSNKAIFKYDIDQNKFSKFIDFENDSDRWLIYGCSFRIHPVTDDAYVSLYHTFTDPTYVTRVYNNNGELKNEYSMISNYWFPSLPVFPDNEAPIVTPLEKQNIGLIDPFTLSLANLATDADNMNAAIVKSVKEVSNREILDAVIANGDLRILPTGKSGEADITIQINSNGKLAESVVAVHISLNHIAGQELVVRSAYTNGQNLYINHCKGFRFTLYGSNGSVVDTFHCGEDLYDAMLRTGSGYYILKGTNGQENVTFKIVVR